jgi:G3E family GTPase
LSPLFQIPTNLILGFLGSGKTTAILHLLKQKPKREKWAVLVNEFGQVGIDGAIYQAAGVTVKEVAGGCLCCAVGLPFQVSVNQLLRQARPDRLLIEPTGLGHPVQLLNRLLNNIAPGVLDVRASICLLDPRYLLDQRYMTNENFIDQMMLADILVANKTDLADQVAMDAFYHQAESYQPEKALVSATCQGQLLLDWLNIPRNPERQAAYPKAHQGERQANAAWQSQGWCFGKECCFDYWALLSVLQQLNAERVKAMVQTDRGAFVIHGVRGQWDILTIETVTDNRIEIIADHLNPETEGHLQQCLLRRR